MRVLIAVAWPYASGPRHLGHAAGAFLPADVCARAHRMAGEEVRMVSGSDQHGTPVLIAAERAGTDVATFADAEHARIAASLARLDVSFDVYTKTHTDEHAQVTREVFARIAGAVEPGMQASAWCAAHRSLPDRYVNGTCPHCGFADARGDQCDACGHVLDPADLRNPRCSRCGEPAELRDIEHLLLRLDKLQPAVAEFVESRAHGWRPFVAAETRGALRAGLRPRAITRDIEWGVPVPGFDGRCFYVWFDAVIGYLTAAGPAWLAPDVRQRYFLGKDNTWFHTIWWPAICIAAGIRPPDDIVATNHLTLAGEQMSSSRGHGFDIDDAIERHGVDQVRHALCALSPEVADVDFTWQLLDDVTRTGLLGAIANPAHRVTSLAAKRGIEIDALAWRRGIGAAALDAVRDAFLDARLRNGVAAVHAIGRSINQRLATTEPWRAPADEARAVLSELLGRVDALAIAAAPVVPQTSARIRAAFGRPPVSDWAPPEVPPQVVDSPTPPLQ